MGKPAAPRKVGEKEALADRQHDPWLGAQAQPRRQPDPRPQGRGSAEHPEVLAQGHGRGRAQGARLGGRQCREQPQPRRRRSGRRRGERRQVDLDEALRDPCARPLERGSSSRSAASASSFASRKKRNGSEILSCRASPADQPDLGQPLVRGRPGLRPAAARGPQDPPLHRREAAAGGDLEGGDRASGQDLPDLASMRRVRA